MLIYMSVFCMVLGYTTFANTNWGILCSIIASVLILVADWKYTELKDRIEKLEQKGGGSDARDFVPGQEGR